MTGSTDTLYNPRLSHFMETYGIVVVVMVMMMVLAAIKPDVFLSAENLTNILKQNASLALLALGMLVVIITGGIDLSVGSIFGMTAIIMGFLWQDSGLPLELAMLLGLGVGFIAGMINAFFIVIIGVPPLITTLATLALYRGIALGISEARSARGFPEWFQDIGRGGIPVNLTIGDQTLAVIPWQLVIIVIAVVIFGVVLSRTTFGRSLYAIGNNEVAARFAGIRTGFAKFVIYTTSGVMASIAAIVFVSRVTTTRSDMGSGIELDAIAAVVLGGTSIFGGSGSILGTILGLILIQVLKNGLLLAGVRGDGTIIMIGGVLIIAVLVNNFIQSKLGSR